MSHKQPHEADELLEGVWKQREKGEMSRDQLLKGTPIKDAEKWLKHLETRKMVTLSTNEVLMTPEGESEAEQIVRRHRLTERLFADVIKTDETAWVKDACELEHKSVLTEEAVNAICAFLGHPPTCPHDRPIPRGDCCARFKKDLKPFVIPLTEASLGKPCRIVFITQKSHSRMERLAVMGILPGSVIKVHQKKPSYVIEAGETEVALDSEIAADIYVKKVNSL